VKVAIVNLGQIVSGDWHAPFVAGDTVVTEGERIAFVGTAAAAAVESANVIIDAGGMTAIPGLIDSHVHVTFGDYTPRQRTVGFLESYVHGGTTTAISASEVHVPGRPSDPEGVKALALAAQRSFATYRPGGMRVLAGSVILEPGLKAADFVELAVNGVRLAKAGFGAVKTAYDYVPLVRDAKAAGLITTCHTGGASIPGSGAITGDHLLAMQPHVSFHINGGPTARQRPRSFRSFHHRHRHADRIGRDAAWHALHDCPLRQPDRHAGGAIHLCRNRQQRPGLWARFGTPRVWLRGRHRVD
jgi:enamidase